MNRFILTKVTLHSKHSVSSVKLTDFHDKFEEWCVQQVENQNLKFKRTRQGVPIPPTVFLTGKDNTVFYQTGKTHFSCILDLFPIEKTKKGCVVWCHIDFTENQYNNNNPKAKELEQIKDELAKIREKVKEKTKNIGYLSAAKKKSLMKDLHPDDSDDEDNDNDNDNDDDESDNDNDEDDEDNDNDEDDEDNDNDETSEASSESDDEEMDDKSSEASSESDDDTDPTWKGKKAKKTEDDSPQKNTRQNVDMLDVWDTEDLDEVSTNEKSQDQELSKKISKHIRHNVVSDDDGDIVMKDIHHEMIDLTKD
jgi:hypothetical protein